MGFLPLGDPWLPRHAPDFAPTPIGLNVAQQRLGKLLRAPVAGNLLDKAIIPDRMQLDLDPPHLARGEGPGWAGFVTPVQDGEVIATAVPAVHVQGLVEIADQMLDPGDGLRLLLPTAALAHDHQLNPQCLEKALAADKGRPIVGQVGIVPGAVLWPGSRSRIHSSG